MNVESNLEIGIYKNNCLWIPLGWESIRLSFIANRPKEEPGFNLEREDVKGRSLRYKVSPLFSKKSRRGPLLIVEKDSMADQVESEKIVNKINLKEEMVSSGVCGS